MASRCESCAIFNAMRAEMDPNAVPAASALLVAANTMEVSPDCAGVPQLPVKVATASNCIYTAAADVIVAVAAAVSMVSLL